VCNRISTAVISLRTAGDSQAADMLTTVESHERDILRAMGEIAQTLATHSAAAV